MCVLPFEEGEGCDGAEESFSACVTDDGELVVLVVAVFLALILVLCIVAVADEVFECFEKVSEEILVDEV